MKTLKSFTLTLGLALMFSLMAYAQSAAQNDQLKQAESCCAMNDGDKSHSAKEGCCCCSGDSCDMNMKESMKNHAAKEGCCCCSGDSCDMKMKENMKNHAAKDGCCCCSGDSCDMNMKDMKKMKHQHKG